MYFIIFIFVFLDEDEDQGGETFPQAPLLLLLTPAFLVRLSPHSESNESSKHRVEGGE